MNITAHKIAMDPTPAQAEMLKRHCGAARVAYNYAIDVFRLSVDTDQWLTTQEWLRPHYNAVKYHLHPWLRDLSQNAGKNAIGNASDAVTKWCAYRKQRKAGRRPRHVGFPRYRSIKRAGYRYQADNGVGTVYTDGRRVKLPNIGYVRMRELPRFAGRVRKAFVSNRAGRWFVTLTYEGESDKPPREVDGIVALDVGLTQHATLFDGWTTQSVSAPKALKANLRGLRRANKRLSRRVLGSNRWRRARDHLARLHARITDIRSDHAHKTTTAIAKLGGLSVVGMETLAIGNMRRNRRVARAFADAGISEWMRQLEYKCKRLGIQVVRVDRWFPSSKLCAWCGERNDGLTLAQREWRCKACKRTVDREDNAARNIWKAASSAVSGRGARVRPVLAQAMGCEASTQQEINRRDARLSEV